METNIRRKREYINNFFENFLENREWNITYSKAFGPWCYLLTIEDEFKPSEDFFIGDMLLDLSLNPSKSFFYSESRINRMYFALQLAELNRHVKVLGYFAYVAVKIKDLVFQGKWYR